MTTLLTPDTVEDRLRRSLAAHAQDMAGRGEEPAAPLDPALLRVDTKVDASGRGPARRALLAAAAVVAVVGSAAAVLTRASGPDGETAIDEAATVERCMPWTDTWSANGGRPLWGVDDPDPDRANIAALVATEPADPGLAHQIDAEQRSAGWFEPHPTDELVAIGEVTGWYRPVAGSGGRVAFLNFDYDDLTVTILAMQVSKADMVAFAESLERGTDGSWRYAVPPGFESLCPSS